MAGRIGKRRILVVGVAVMGLLSAFVGGAYATHVFSDVPSNAFYHDDVTWLASKGITGGCGGGKYCPNNAVTRGQMATFLHALVDQNRVGNFSCDAYGFQPASSSQTFLIGGGGAFSDGSLSCPVHVPDGATITKLSVAVNDTHASDLTCNLYRQDILNSPFSTYGLMAQVASSGAGGAARLTDTTVSTPAVDNNQYAYIVFCTFGASAGNLVVYGAAVQYTHKGVPAP